MPKDEAADILALVTKLHGLGYGRAKLFCYIKDGMAWRFFIFADDQFPESRAALPEDTIEGSIPGWNLFKNKTLEESLEIIRRESPNFLAKAVGEDTIYVQWLAEMQHMFPRQTLEMESPFSASMNGQRVPTPMFATVIKSK